MRGPIVGDHSEHTALRRGAGILDLGGRGLLRLGGADRAQFLNNLVTNDILALRPGQGCQALKVSLQGRMEAALRVLCLEDALWCDVDAGVMESLVPALGRRILRDDVRLEDVRGAWTIVSLQGPGAADVLARLGVDVAAAPALHRHAPVDIAGVAGRLVGSDHTGDGGFDLWVPRPEGERVRAALRVAGAVRVGAATHNVRRVEAGIPWQGAEITPEHFPQEAGLDDGWISYTKGCYLGQETVARLHHLGHVNRHLRGVVFEATGAAAALPDPGAKLVAADKEVGEITSVVHSIALARPIALAYVRHGFDAATVDGGDAAAVAAHVVPLPFTPDAGGTGGRSSQEF